MIVTNHCLYRRLVLVSFVLTLLSACVMTPVDRPVEDRRITATLLTDGDTVRVNGRRAKAGQPIRPGDLVTTGPGSSALIRFSDGTTVQLDENTDPILRWTGDRLHIRMEDGAIEVSKGGWFNFIELIGDLADFFSWSNFVVEERRTRFFRVDLFSGRMQVTRPQTGPAQLGGEYFLVRAGSAEVEFGRTSAKRVAELRRRFDHWDFTRAEPIPRTRIWRNLTPNLFPDIFRRRPKRQRQPDPDYSPSEPVGPD